MTGKHEAAVRARAASGTPVMLNARGSRRRVVVVSALGASLPMASLLREGSGSDGGALPCRWRRQCAALVLAVAPRCGRRRRSSSPNGAASCDERRSGARRTTRPDAIVEPCPSRCCSPLAVGVVAARVAAAAACCSLRRLVRGIARARHRRGARDLHDPAPGDAARRSTCAAASTTATRRAAGAPPARAARLRGPRPRRPRPASSRSTAATRCAPSPSRLAADGRAPARQAAAVPRRIADRARHEPDAVAAPDLARRRASTGAIVAFAARRAGRPRARDGRGGRLGRGAARARRARRLARGARRGRGARPARPDQPALHLQRAQRDRVVHQHRPRARPASSCSSSPTSRATRSAAHGDFTTVAEELRSDRQLPAARARPLRRAPDGDAADRPRGARRRSSRSSACSRSSRTPCGTGSSRSESGGRITITRRRRRRVRRDQRRGRRRRHRPRRARRRRSPGGAPGEHVGLRNVDARLRQVYGDEHGLVVETNVGAGTLVRMRVPKSQPQPRRGDRRGRCDDADRPMISRAHRRRRAARARRARVPARPGSAHRRRSTAPRRGRGRCACSRSEPIDAAFLDIHMPGLSGFDLARALAPLRAPAGARLRDRRRGGRARGVRPRRRRLPAEAGARRAARTRSVTRCIGGAAGPAAAPAGASRTAHRSTR